MMLPACSVTVRGAAQMLRGWKGFILCLLCLYFSRSPALDSFGVTLPIALFPLALCLFSAHPYNLVRKQGQRAWGGGKGGEAVLFSHCVWRTVPLLISTVGTQRFGCWEFKRRLPGCWHLWCSSRVYMFWNVKHAPKFCFQLCLSSPNEWKAFWASQGFRRKRGRPSMSGQWHRCSASFSNAINTLCLLATQVTH